MKRQNRPLAHECVSVTGLDKYPVVRLHSPEMSSTVYGRSSNARIHLTVCPRCLCACLGARHFSSSLQAFRCVMFSVPAALVVRPLASISTHSPLAVCVPSHCRLDTSFVKATFWVSSWCRRHYTASRHSPMTVRVSHGVLTLENVLSCRFIFVVSVHLFGFDTFLSWSLLGR